MAQGSEVFSSDGESESEDFSSDSDHKLEHKQEEKNFLMDSPEEEKTSSELLIIDRKRLGGRRHTEAQMIEILDEYLISGRLPTYVSDRQRTSYRNDDRLPERKRILEQQGNRTIDLYATGKFKKVIIPLDEERKKRARKA